MANLPGPVMGSNAVGVPILTGQFANLSLVVEIAWGANLAADSGTWAWTDVTTDVQVDNNKMVSCSSGRRDERSVAGPASCTFSLDNRMNKYSASPLGLNWPNVKRGVPVRVRAILNDKSTTLFQGNAASLTPSFDSTGQYAIVNVVANGILRRLGQGNQAVQSTMRAYTPNVSNLVAYWPMEDGTSALSFASVTPGAAPITWTGTMQLHSNTTLVGSDALPVFSSATAIGAVPTYTATNAVQARLLVAWPAAGSALPDGTPLLRLFTTGSLAQWDLVYGTGGSLHVQAYDGTENLVFDSGAVGFSVDNTAGQVALSLSQSGSNIAVQFSTYTQGAGAAGYSNATVTGQTITAVTSFAILPNGGSTSVALGHLTIQSAATDIFENAQPVSAYDGETTDARQGRLLVLAGAESRGMFGSSTLTRMGPQKIDTVLNLIRECESTAVGLILDGHDASVTTWAHAALENLSTYITIDATSGAIVPPFEPTDDDQLLRNQWTVSQRNGGSVVYYDKTGTLGSNNVGLYADSETVNVSQNPNGSYTGALGIKALQDRAGWLVHEGTVEGYRYPTLEVAFHHTPSLLTNSLVIQAGGVGRIDITNLSTVYPQLQTGTISLLVVGLSHTINQFLWTTTFNCIPFDPWRVAVLAQTSGDTGEFIDHLDTSGSTLKTTADAGSSTLSVTTTTGPIWTTDPDDVPLTVSIGGLPVTVTAISGSSSPQTFTVDPTTVTKTLTAGLAVNVWKPPVLAIGGTS